MTLLLRYEPKDVTKIIRRHRADMERHRGRQGRVYIQDLAQGMKFESASAPVTADDIAWSMQRAA